MKIPELFSQQPGRHTFERSDQAGQGHLGRVVDQQMHMVMLAVELHQLGIKILAHAGHDQLHGIQMLLPEHVMDCTKTLRLRIKDKHARVLSAMAREVNQVWNFCNETSRRAIRERHQWLSGYDLQKLTNGYSKCDGKCLLQTLH